MNQLDLEGRAAVITGGSGGIGFAIAQRFASSRAKVALWDINLEAANAAAAKIGALLLCRVNVTDQASVAAAARETFARLGSIDILINSAGVMQAGGIEGVDIAEYRRVFDINVFATLYSWSAAVPTRHAASRRFGRRCPTGPRRCPAVPGRNSRTTGDIRRWP